MLVWFGYGEGRGEGNVPEDVIPLPNARDALGQALLEDAVVDVFLVVGRRRRRPQVRELWLCGAGLALRQAALRIEQGLHLCRRSLAFFGLAAHD